QPTPSDARELYSCIAPTQPEAVARAPQPDRLAPLLGVWSRSGDCGTGSNLTLVIARTMFIELVPQTIIRDEQHRIPAGYEVVPDGVRMRVAGNPRVDGIDRAEWVPGLTTVGVGVVLRREGDTLRFVRLISASGDSRPEPPDAPLLHF